MKTLISSVVFSLILSTGVMASTGDLVKQSGKGNSAEVETGDIGWVMGSICNQSGNNNDCDIDIDKVEGSINITGGNVTVTHEKDPQVEINKNNIQVAVGSIGSNQADIKNIKDRLDSGEFKGEKGDQGLQGIAGKDGVDGKNGVDGKDGKDGKQGLKGDSVTIKEEDGKLIVSVEGSDQSFDFTDNIRSDDDIKSIADKSVKDQAKIQSKTDKTQDNKIGKVNNKVDKINANLTGRVDNINDRLIKQYHVDVANTKDIKTNSNNIQSLTGKVDSNHDYTVSEVNRLDKYNNSQDIRITAAEKEIYSTTQRSLSNEKRSKKNTQDILFLREDIKRLDGMIAAQQAANSIVVPSNFNGNISIGVGVGHYRGNNGLALGVLHDGGNYAIKITASGTDSDNWNDLAIGASINFGF